MKNLPLAGLTVISLEQAVAAPFAARQLADLGARVIKIERDTGDFARGYDEKVGGLASYFVWLNRGKESVVLDLKSDAGIDALKALVADADVLIQNLAPGAVERMGLGADMALALNPRLIHVSISGYGTGGEYENKKAYDLLVQCEAGLLSVTGTEENLAKVGVSIADIAAGMYAYTGVLTSLINRGITGQGDVIEVSMLEALGEWMMQPYLYAEYGGVQQPRSGAQHATIAPYGPFHAKDGTVFLAIQNEREWLKFCSEVLDNPVVGANFDYSNNALRVQHREELHADVDRVLSGLTADEVLARLDSAGIANARLRDMAEFSAHPQLEQRKRWMDVATAAGPVRSLIPPVTSRNVGFRMDAVPTVGEHTAHVLNQLQETR